jgi:hypothetical protein
MPQENQKRQIYYMILDGKKGKNILQTNVIKTSCFSLFNRFKSNMAAKYMHIVF